MKLLPIGLLLTAVAWIAAWGRFGILTELSFFPLWAGYILAINGISEVLIHQSLLRRMGAPFLALFVFSVPMWWFFELLNSIVHNWHYIFAQPISDLRFAVQASIDFSTVIPAILSTGYLVHQLLLQHALLPDCTPVRLRQSYRVVFLLIGIAGFCALALFPQETFPLVWIAPLLLLEPLAYWAGKPCFLRLLENGQRRPAASIMLATMVTGFFWEMWNYYSLPKWIYTIPYLGFWKIFEMPFLGYLGYPFFGLIVFTYTAVISSVLLKQDLAELIAEPPAVRRQA
jgi:hypothetical protein